jgi:putative endonuclease
MSRTSPPKADEPRDCGSKHHRCFMPRLPEFSRGWYCYLLHCSDGSYYCGIASNLKQRIRDHSSGKGSGYTKGSRPIALVWYETRTGPDHAAAREKQIKAWSHDKKKRLAEGKPEFAGFGTRVAVSLGWRSGLALPLDGTIASDKEAMSRVT